MLDGIGFVSLDVRQTGGVPTTFDAAEATLGGPIDILVNAAGIYPCDPILEMAEEAWDRVLYVNLKGMFLVSQKCCRRLVTHRLAGAIVDITWGAAERARVGAAHYCTSTAGAEMLTRAFPLEFAEHNILGEHRLAGLCRGEQRGEPAQHRLCRNDHQNHPARPRRDAG